jgi:chemotaxis protein MotB
MKSPALLFLLVTALLGGCVTRRSFDEQIAALQACRDEAQAQLGELNRCRDDAKAQLGELTAQRAQAQALSGELNAQRERSETVVAELNRYRAAADARLAACADEGRKLADGLAKAQQEAISCARDVDALRGKARAELFSCVAARHGLEGDLAGARRELEGCLMSVAAARASVKALDDRATELRAKLQTEIAQKSVEIERLKDQLSVRVLDRILFRSGSADILPEGRKVLDTLAGAIASGNELIRVEGHTDAVPIGTQLMEKYPTNWELSTARSSSVVRYFENVHTIDPQRMEAVGFSMHRPVAVGDTPEQLQRNRRVEIVLTAPKPR